MEPVPLLNHSAVHCSAPAVSHHAARTLTPAKCLANLEEATSRSLFRNCSSMKASYLPNVHTLYVNLYSTLKSFTLLCDPSCHKQASFTSASVLHALLRQSHRKIHVLDNYRSSFCPSLTKKQTQFVE